MINIFFSPFSAQPTQVKSGHDAQSAQLNNQTSSLDRMLDRLAENIPDMGGDDLKALDAGDYTPEKVASRIAGFVASGLAAAAERGASDERLNELYQAAVKGVEKGFAEARDILDSLNVLQGDLAAQVDATEAATYDALAEIAPASIQNPLSATGSARMGIIERFSNAEDMELKVVTRDGDEVTISFSRDQSYQSRFAAASDGQGNSVAMFSLSRSERSEYQFSVNGSLDQGEIDALQNLIKDVSSLADEFFDGDLQRAFEQSANLSFDSSELSSMNLEMSYTRSYASAAGYEQVQQLEQPQDKPGRRLGHLMKDLAESFGAPSLGFLNSPGHFGRDLLSGLVTQDSRYITAPDEQQSIYDDNLLQLLDAVLPAEPVEPLINDGDEA